MSQTAMTQLQAIPWVMSLCTNRRLSQAKTLTALAAAALSVERLSLAARGRKLWGDGLAKHRIKRAWRFCANGRVAVSDAMTGLLQRLRKRRQAKKGVGTLRQRKVKPVMLAFDWTDLQHFHTLMLAVVQKGRARPLLWATYTKWKLHRSQNNLEEGLLRLFWSMGPPGTPLILLADRGFGRTELARTCQQLGIRYLIRIKPDVYIDSPEHRGNLQDLPVKKGMALVLKQVRYRKDDPVVHNVVVRWKEGLPKKRDEPWFLMTDLNRRAVELTNLYGKRMTVEELFRDDKHHRHGLALRHTQITKPERIDRLLLIVAMAYWLLVGIGLWAQKQYRPGAWCSSNDPEQCSVFTIGRIMREHMEVSPEAAFAAAAAATEEAAPKWG